MNHKRLVWPLISLMACALTVTLVKPSAGGQSGRKPPRRTEPPAEAPTSASKETEPAEPEQAKPKLSIVVARDSALGTFSIDPYYDSVLRGCLDRLRESYGVKVISGSEMNRKEAHDLAKRSTDTYVTWIQLGTDSLGAPETTLDSRNLFVEFTLFAPGTGKAKTQGRVYLGQVARNGNVGVGIPTPTTGVAVDYHYQRAGRETANRVLSALGLVLPPNR